MKKVVILDYATLLQNNDISLECFEKFFEVRKYPLTPDEKAIERIGDAEIVLCNKVKITREVMEKCPNIEYIGLFATGYNNIDTECAGEKGIAVCNAGSYSTEAVSQHTFALILYFFNKVAQYNKAVSDGEWSHSETFSYFPYTVSELAGKTMAVIGYGSIGKQTAKLADDFGMKVIISTRTKPENCKYEQVTTEEAFKRADVLTVHCPLTPQTENLICRKNLELMKPSAIVINTARGGIVNEQELADALNNGVIAGAGLDVLREEPMSETTPLKNAKNCIITPHIAWAGIETRKRVVEIAKDNLLSYLNGVRRNRIV